MAKDKACKTCKLIYYEDTCPSCGKKEVSETFKGRVEIVDKDRSVLAKELKINKNGFYAIKL